MELEPRLLVFWLVHLATLALFVVGLLAILAVWLKARIPGLPANASRWRKLWAGIGFIIGFVFSRRIWIFLKSLVVDGLAIRRLMHTDKRRWLVHLSIFGSWLILGVLSTITGVVVEFLPRLGMSPEQVASIPIIGQMYHADVWWVALLNDVLGLVVLVGMLFVLNRRYRQKDAQLRTTRVDTLILALLTLVAFSGFPTETFRLLANYTNAAGVFAPAPSMIPLDKLPEVLYPVWGPQWGFIGYVSALVLGALHLSAGFWEVFHNIAFFLHFAIVLALLYLLPFSRFFHIIMGPTVVAYNTTVERMEQEKRRGKALPQPAAAKGGQA